MHAAVGDRSDTDRLPGRTPATHDHRCTKRNEAELARTLYSIAGTHHATRRQNVRITRRHLGRLTCQNDWNNTGEKIKRHKTSSTRRDLSGELSS